MWLPKYLETALFSNNKEIWKKEKFIYYNPNSFYKFIGLNYIFKYCKPLPKIISFIQFLKDNNAYEKYMYNIKIENQRWSEIEKYKTLSEIKKMHPISWLQIFNWIYTKEGNDFWNKLDIKWKQFYRKNIDNIIWE